MFLVYSGAYMQNISTLFRGPLLALAPLFFLSACGGSKSSSPTTTVTSGTPSVGVWTAAGTAVGTTNTGPTQTATLSGGTTSTVDNGGTPGTATLTTTASGATFSAPNTGGNVALTSMPGTTTTAGITGTQWSGQTTTGATVTVEALGGGNNLWSSTATNLSYSDYGIWMISSGGAVTNVGAYAVGARTPVASMPTTGTASYGGTAAGVITTGSNIYNFSGSTYLYANFGANAIIGNVFTPSVYAVTGSPTTSVGTLNTINFISGAIAGNGFAGTVGTNPTPGTAVNIGSATGTFSGNFYGSAAQEATGTFQMSGGGNSLVGSFGTHK